MALQVHIASLYIHCEKRCKTLQKYVCGFPVATNIILLWQNFTKGAISLILTCESTIHQVKNLVLIHFTCTCKNCAPKCSQFPHKLVIYLLFQASRHTKQKNYLEITPIVLYIYPEQPHQSSTHCKNQISVLIGLMRKKKVPPEIQTRDLWNSMRDSYNCTKWSS